MRKIINDIAEYLGIDPTILFVLIIIIFSYLWIDVLRNRDRESPARIMFAILSLIAVIFFIIFNIIRLIG